MASVRVLAPLLGTPPVMTHTVLERVLCPSSPWSADPAGEGSPWLVLESFPSLAEWKAKSKTENEKQGPLASGHESV